MKNLNRFDRYAVYYFVFTSPIFITFMVWASLEFKGAANPADLNGGFWDIFGWFFIAWVLDLLYIVTKMLFSKIFRDILMAKLAGIQERDEREVVVAGNAAKFAYLSTFALLLFMLVFSVTNLKVAKDPTRASENKGTVTIGFGAKLTDDTAIMYEKKDKDNFSFSYNSLPLSKPFMLIFLMIWQIGSYHLIARKELVN